MTQEYDIERIEGRTIKELAQLNTELLEALKTIQVVNAGAGPLRREIIEATCDSAIRKASR